MAATEYSTDASLDAAKFASCALASTVTSCHLLWLRHWRVDMKSKWKLAYTFKGCICKAPYKGSSLFGEALEQILVEDKRKIMPSSYRRPDRRYLPYTQTFGLRTDLAGPILTDPTPKGLTSLLTGLHSEIEVDANLRPSAHLEGQATGPSEEASQVLLSPDRCLSIRTLVTQILSLRLVPLILLSQLLGKMISCIAIIPWARFHAQPLQWYLLPYQKSCRSNSRAKVLLRATDRLSFRW